MTVLPEYTASPPRCTACDKVIHASRKRAAEEAMWMRDTTGEVLDWYKCAEKHWHVGHPATLERWEALKARHSRRLNRIRRST